MNSYLIMTVGAFIAAVGLMTIGYAWLTGIARNPEAADKMFTPGIIVAALCEFIALLCFAVVYLDKLSG